MRERVWWEFCRLTGVGEYLVMLMRKRGCPLSKSVDKGGMTRVKSTSDLFSYRFSTLIPHLTSSLPDAPLVPPSFPPHPPAIPSPLPSPLQLGDIARGPLKKRPKVVNVDVLSNVSGYLMPGAFTLILGEMGIRVLCGGLQRCLPKSD